jgi:hypothetical protein
MGLKPTKTIVSVERSIRRTADGNQYDLEADVWGPFISGGRRIRYDFRELAGSCHPDFIGVIKNGLSERLDNVATGTALNGLTALKKAIESLIGTGRVSKPIKELTKVQLVYVLTSVGAISSIKLIQLLRVCKGALTEAAYEHVMNNDAVYDDIETQDVVLTLHPTKGPYLDAEILTVDNALLAAFEAAEIDRQRYLLAMTFRLYGIRPVTCSEIKLGDIELTDPRSVRVRFRINKQRNAVTAHSPFRPAPMLYGSLLREEVAQLSNGFSASGWQSFPLFPFEHETWKGRRHYTGNGNLDGVTGSNTISERYQSIMGQLNIVSPRTGERMVINARRDRHTVATQLALQGCSAEVIAAWMLHADVTSCESYVELATKHYQVMDSLLDGKFTHLAGRFFGEVVAAKDLDQFGDYGIIVDPEGNVDEVGGCAAGGCAAIETLSAPYACFTCPSLRLSRSADLNPLLKALLEKRRSSSSDGQTEYVASLDRHIAATHAAKIALESCIE